MSPFRQAEIADMLTHWLDRYAPPLHLRDKPKAAQDEVEALLRALTKFAPHTEYQAFVRQVFESLEQSLKGRVWPTIAEIGAACSNTRKEAARTGQASPLVEPDDAARTIADKMGRGEAVGEGWLWGIGAVELAARGLIGEETMRRYRSAAFFARRDLYGEASAHDWEDDAKDRHESAKHVYRQREAERRQKAIAIPDKRAPMPRGVLA